MFKLDKNILTPNTEIASDDDDFSTPIPAFVDRTLAARVVEMEAWGFTRGRIRHETILICKARFVGDCRLPNTEERAIILSLMGRVNGGRFLAWIRKNIKIKIFSPREKAKIARDVEAGLGFKKMYEIIAKKRARYAARRVVSLPKLVMTYRANAARAYRPASRPLAKNGTDGGNSSDPDLPSHTNHSRSFNLQIFAHQPAQSQRATIIRYLSTGATATQKELWSKFGVAQAGARICEARKLGWQIKSTYPDTNNPRVAHYRLDPHTPFIAPPKRSTGRTFDLQKFAEMQPSDRERLTNQNMKILNFLQAGGVGTQSEIRDTLIIAQPGARIAELRKDGYNVLTTMKPTESGVLIAHYSLDLENPRRKPTQFLQVDADGIPDELKAVPNWVCWTGKKIPIQYDGKSASSTDPATWTTFDRAFEGYQELHFNGIGFVFTRESGIVGVDLDGAIREDGTLHSWAEAIVQAFACYTEISPRGGGLHIFTKGTIEKVVKTKEVEVYDCKRYFTVTGQLWSDNLTQIHERQNVLDNLIAQIQPKPKNILRKYSVPFRQPASVDEIVECGLRNPKFARLWNGDISDYGNDDSRADCALLTFLLKLSGGNEGIATSLFQQSALAERAKAERPDYIPRTLAACRHFMTGGAF